MNWGQFSSVHLRNEVSVEVGYPHVDNMLKYGCAMNRNHAFQVGYFSRKTLSHVSCFAVQRMIQGDNK